jgi:hypothetical protein
MFRETTRGAFYVYGIFPSGRYVLQRYDPDRNEFVTIIPVSLFANGQFVAEANDSAIPRGNIGLVAGNTGVHLAATSVKVTR